MLTLLLLLHVDGLQPGVLVDTPVYSLATLDSTGQTNMNIVTYASAVGIRPERMWCLSLYKGTKTHANFGQRKRCVLQLLTEEHTDLVWTLGGTSGGDKQKSLEWEPREWCDEFLLPRCSAYVSLEETERYGAGDHDVVLCRAVHTEVSDRRHLTTRQLRARGLVSDLGRAVPPLVGKALHRDPDVYLFEDVLTREECDELVEVARSKNLTTSNAPAAQFDLMRLALIIPFVLAAPIPTLLRHGNPWPVLAEAMSLACFAALVILEVAERFAGTRRTSSAVALNEDATALPVARRLAALLNTTVERMEAPVVSRYEGGQLFSTHNDASADPDGDWGDSGGQRLKTCILYLNDVDEGGATYFDQLDLRVQPKAGQACVFFPADATTLRPDPRTTHASEPAVDEKWICQTWERENVVPPPSGLDVAALLR